MNNINLDSFLKTLKVEKDLTYWLIEFELEGQECWAINENPYGLIVFDTKENANEYIRLNYDDGNYHHVRAHSILADKIMDTAKECEVPHILFCNDEDLISSIPVVY